MAVRKQKPGFQTATLLAGVVMLLIIFVSAGYILTLPPADQDGGQFENQDPAIAEIRRQRELWRRQRPDSFEYVVDRSCECADDFAAPYRVIVDATGTEFRFDADYGQSSADRLPPEPADIELLFDLIEAALISGHNVQVFYDSDYGYPAIARINQPGNRSDEEFAFDVRGFRVRL